MSQNTNDRRRVSLQNINSEGYIPFLAGRPNREKVISKNDLMNLKISLNTTKTIDDFLKII